MNSSGPGQVSPHLGYLSQCQVWGTADCTLESFWED
jgi:hypothetical protein